MLVFIVLLEGIPTRVLTNALLLRAWGDERVGMNAGNACLAESRVA